MVENYAAYASDRVLSAREADCVRSEEPAAPRDGIGAALRCSCSNRTRRGGSAPHRAHPDGSETTGGRPRVSGDAPRTRPRYARAPVRPNYTEMSSYAVPYLQRAQQFDEQGDERVLPYSALGVAYELGSAWRVPATRRGEFFDVVSKSMAAILRDVSALAVLKARLPRVRHLVRRTRLADVLWEFGDRQVDAARIAVNGYIEQARRGFASDEEHAPMYAAGAASRALAIARGIRDAGLVGAATAQIAAALPRLVAAVENVAAFTLAETVVAWGMTELYEPVDQHLSALLSSLRASEFNTFHHQQKALELLLAVATRLGKADRAQQLRVEIGETMVREATSKPEGSGANLVLTERAAVYFERTLHDRDRAVELRRGQRTIVAAMTFGTVGGEFGTSLPPIRAWIEDVLARFDRRVFWSLTPFAFPLPTPKALAQMISDAQSEVPFLALIGHEPIEAGGIKESVPAAAAMTRLVREQVYGMSAVRYRVLVDLAKEEYGITAQEALQLFESSGRFDATAVALSRRVLAAVDSGDWVTAAHLAAPLFERLLRRVAEDAGIWVRYSNTAGGGSRQEYRAVEELLRELPLSEPLREFAKQVLTYPGQNLRNEVGHGYLDEDRCTPELGGQLVQLLIQLAQADLAGTLSPP